VRGLMQRDCDNDRYREDCYRRKLLHAPTLSAPSTIPRAERGDLATIHLTV
jgi:hypothetical protein